jgi:hypothetical protein
MRRLLSPNPGAYGSLFLTQVQPGRDEKSGVFKHQGLALQLRRKRAQGGLRAAARLDFRFASPNISRL